MVPMNDDKAVTEVVNLLSRDVRARKALAAALLSCDLAGLQRAILHACGIELSAETAAALLSRDRLASAKLHLFML